MASPNRRRKNYWLKKSFQSSFSLRFSILLLIEAGLIAFLFFYISKGTLTTGYDGSAIRVEHTGQFFRDSFLLIASVTALAIGIAASLLFIVLSHRIAGPAFHIQKSLRELANGNLTYQIRLRKKDELRDVAEDVNLAARSIEGKISRMKREIGRAEKLEGKALQNLKELVDSFKTSS